MNRNLILNVDSYKTSHYLQYPPGTEYVSSYIESRGGVYPEAWAYDPSSDAWTALPDMPNPRHGLGAVAVGEDIYVIGGALEVGGSKTSNLVEIFTPA